tara:strand:- start:433 stop:807 length:375 start_codon:yes stop_codon:yes gene_type:complete
MSNIDYNYNYIVKYKHILGDPGDTHYRLQFLKCFNCDINNTDAWNKIIKKQDQISERFKNSTYLPLILEHIKKNNKSPFGNSKEMLFVMLFTYDYFESFHPCLKDLFINNEITKENYENFISNN